MYALCKAGGRNASSIRSVCAFLQKEASVLESLQQMRLKSDALFPHVPMAPKDPILGITENFLADKSPEKMNLGVGAYRDDNNKPVVLDVVREAEKLIGGKLFMEYLPIGGSQQFVASSLKLAYGDDSEALKAGRVAGIQSLSGTGACRLFADFVHRYLPDSTVYVPVPTWSNHINILRDANVKQSKYRYYLPASRGLDYDGLLEDLEAAPSGSIFLLHACAHNPTGVDPTLEQWRSISKVFLKKKHFPLFDMAYQGFASGDCDRDAQAIRVFMEDGHNLALCQSYAKNMGLYGQRIGALSMVCSSKDEAVRVESQLRGIARPMYSNPPMHGALLVNTILSDPKLKKEWFAEVKGMAERIISMRLLLRQKLEESGSKLKWGHVTDQIGMFAFSGMTPEQVDRLASEFHVYMTRDGRISMAGVTTANVERLAQSIHKVTSS